MAAASLGAGRASVRLTVANGNGRHHVAATAAARLTALGYARAAFDDARRPHLLTVVLVRPGFDALGNLIASDLGLAPERVEALPLPPAKPTIDAEGDAGADVVLVLGADWPT